MEAGKVASQLLPSLQLDLERANIIVDVKRYLAMCLAATSFFLVIMTSLLFLVFFQKGLEFWAAGAGILLSGMLFLLQVNYPKVVAHKRIRKLDADLLAALRAIMIQINSGVPLFEAMVIISKQQFGEISSEFRKVVTQINSGVPQIEALETITLKNPSPYFRRTLWQIINAMKEGAASTEVMANVISNLTKEQIIQIEKYGAQLSPMAMFYMLVAVIIPSLGITFLIIFLAFLGLPELLMKGVFWVFYAGILFFQIMFLGIIKSRRPNLMAGD